MGRLLLARWHIVTAGFTQSERGASLVEYAVLGLLIAVAAAAALRLLGEAAAGSYQDYTQRLNDA